MTEFSPVKLAYNVIEPTNKVAEKAPIIFLHGLFACKEMWEDIPQIAADKTGRKVYNVDSRNHGDSEWSDVFSFDTNADDLIDFMDSHNIPKAIVIGHSMGGITAIRAALKYPDRIESFITEDISPKSAPAAAFDMVKLFLNLATKAIQQVPSGATEAETRKSIKEFIFNGLPPEMQEQLKDRFTKDLPFPLKQTTDGRYIYKSNVKVLLKYIDELNSTETDLSDRTYAGPAFFIYGKKSPFLVGADEAYIKQIFPAAELVGIADATHTVHTDCPQEFTEILINFLLKQ